MSDSRQPMWGGSFRPAHFSFAWCVLTGAQEIKRPGKSGEKAEARHGSHGSHGSNLGQDPCHPCDPWLIHTSARIAVTAHRLIDLAIRRSKLRGGLRFRIGDALSMKL